MPRRDSFILPSAWGKGSAGENDSHLNLGRTITMEGSNKGHSMQLKHLLSSISGHKNTHSPANAGGSDPVPLFPYAEEFSMPGRGSTAGPKSASEALRFRSDRRHGQGHCRQAQRRASPRAGGASLPDAGWPPLSDTAYCPPPTV